MRLSNGRRPSRLMPSPTEAGARRPIFSRALKSRRIRSDDRSLRELTYHVLRLRLKVSMPNEAQTICNARGPGLNLRAAS
jgi:hypothetical protein